MKIFFLTLFILFLGFLGFSSLSFSNNSGWDVSWISSGSSFSSSKLISNLNHLNNTKVKTPPKCEGALTWNGSNWGCINSTLVARAPIPADDSNSPNPDSGSETTHKETHRKTTYKTSSSGKRKNSDTVGEKSDLASCSSGTLISCDSVSVSNAKEKNNPKFSIYKSGNSCYGKIVSASESDDACTPGHICYMSLSMTCSGEPENNFDKNIDLLESNINSNGQLR